MSIVSSPSRGLVVGLIDNLANGFDGGDGFDHLSFFAKLDGATVFDVSFFQLASAEDFFHDFVISLGPSTGIAHLAFGYDLFASGDGGFAFDFAVGGAVPEAST